MEVKIKKLHKNSVIPSYSKEGDAGLDLTALSVRYDYDTDTIVYDTGIAIEIPKGYVGLIFPRSSIYKKELILSNHVGVVDSSYRGSIKLIFKPDIGNFWDIANKNKDEFQEGLEHGVLSYYESGENANRNWAIDADIYAVGDRIGQLIIIPYPQIQFKEVEELSTTERGEGGFGSSGA